MTVTEMDVLADVVSQAIETATAPLLARIAVLEKRQLLHGKDGRDGRDAAVDIDTLAIKAAALVPRPADGINGKDAPAVDLESLAAKAAALVPKPADGINGLEGPAGKDGERGERGEKGLDGVAGQTGPQGEPGPAGRDGTDGKDADIPALQAFIESAVETAVRGAVTKAIGTLAPPRDGKDGRDGQDGRSVTIDDVAPLIVSEVTKAVSVLPKAADGVGIVDALIDRDKALVFTFSDGRTKSVGPVVGADGKAGADGQNGRDGADGKAGADGQNGRDGSDGKAGADGLGFDDLDVYMDAAKGFVIRFQQADRVKEFPFPMMWDAGIYKPGTLYPKGAGVTAQGSFWIAQADTSERPGDGSTSWRLAVKRGRDGKDGKNGDGGQP